MIVGAAAGERPVVVGDAGVGWLHAKRGQTTSWRILMYHDEVTLQKFSSQARPELLEEVRALAAEEGRQFQAVLDEALAEWVAKKKGEAPRPEVIRHLKASIARHRKLYEELAK